MPPVSICNTRSFPRDAWTFRPEIFRSRGALAAFRPGISSVPRRGAKVGRPTPLVMIARTLSLCASLTFAVALPAQDAGLPPPVRLETGVSGHIHPALAVTPRGTLVAVFCKSEFKPHLITRSTDGGRSWAKPELFSPTIGTDVYPGSLTTLADGRLVHAWNVWYAATEKQKSRYVAYSISRDDGVTWSAPKNLRRSQDSKLHSVIRHPILELSPTAWLLALIDRTVVYNPVTGEESAFGDGQNHGLVPIVRTATGALVSGKGLRSTDGGRSWHESKAMPDLHTNGWRFEMVALRNGLLFLSQIAGPGFGGEKIHFVVSRDDGRSWDVDHPVEFYNPNRPIGGRSCPRTVELDPRNLGTIFYDTDAKQAGGSGVFFRAMPTERLGKR